MSLSASLISFFELEEASGSRADSAGSNTLTDNNTVTSGVGIVGTAASFASGSSEFLSHASNSSLEMGDIDFSICAWFKPVSSVADSMIVAKDDDAANSRDYTMDIISMHANFYVNGGGLGIASSGVLITAGNWFFVVGWHDSVANTMNVSVNDETPVSQSTGGTAPNLSAAQFMLGAREYAGFEGYFNGLIDQVGVWKRTLTSLERTDLYNAGAGRSYAYISGGAATKGQPFFSGRQPKFYTPKRRIQ